MIPYIAVLILLIVVILYQVYSQTDSFTDASGTRIVVSDASGNRTVTKDASGNEITMSLSDLFALLGPFTMADASTTTPSTTTPSTTTPSTTTPSTTTPSTTTPSSPTGPTACAPAAAAETKPTEASTKEVEERIAKTVAKQVKDTLLSQRAVDDVHDKYAPCDLTDAEAQGQDYETQYPRPSRSPDMSEYIRKDSIPCWNCAVP